jgi:hypothetical protein
MSFLKKMATNASQSLHALGTSTVDKTPGAGSQKSNTAAIFYNVKRRATENVLQKLGKAHKTEDSEYESAKSAAMEVQHQVASLSKGITAFVQGARNLSLAGSDVGATLQGLFASGDHLHASAQSMGASSAANSMSLSTYTATLSSLDSEAGPRAQAEATLLSLLQETKDFAAEIELIKLPCKERELLKVDYDSRLRKVRAMKEKGPGGNNLEKLAKKEHKLAVTEETLTNLTVQLMGKFAEVERRRYAIIGRVTAEFVSGGKSFFRGCLQTLDALPSPAPFAAGAGSAMSGYTAFPSTTSASAFGMYGKAGGRQGGKDVWTGSSDFDFPAPGAASAPPAAAKQAITSTSQRALPGMGGAPPTHSSRSLLGAAATDDAQKGGVKHRSLASFGADPDADSNPTATAPFLDSERPPSVSSAGTGDAASPPFGTSVSRSSAPKGTGFVSARAAAFNGAKTLPSTSAGATQGATARVLFDYAPKQADELELRVGDGIRVLSKGADGWWKGQRADGKVGVFPSNYVSA